MQKHAGQQALVRSTVLKPLGSHAPAPSSASDLPALYVLLPALYVLRGCVQGCVRQVGSAPCCLVACRERLGNSGLATLRDEEAHNKNTLQA